MHLWRGVMETGHWVVDAPTAVCPFPFPSLRVFTVIPQTYTTPFLRRSFSRARTVFCIKYFKINCGIKMQDRHLNLLCGFGLNQTQAIFKDGQKFLYLIMLYCSEVTKTQYIITLGSNNCTFMPMNGYSEDPQLRSVGKKKLNRPEWL